MGGRVLSGVVDSVAARWQHFRPPFFPPPLPWSGGRGGEGGELGGDSVTDSLFVCFG